MNKKKPDYLLILSWHIADFLIKNFKKKGYRGKFIIPLPEPYILSKTKKFIPVSKTPRVI